jgi:tRNA nucleotidyltransferase (CCA-adding enzyme)
MPSIDEILSEVLETIIPTPREIAYISNVTKNLQEKIEKKSKELKIDYTVIEPQGSTGIKQTQLRNDFDIDLFIGLDYQYYRPKYKGLSKNKLKKVSKKDFLELCTKWIIPSLSTEEFNNPRLLYAEHPYVTVDYSLEDIKTKIDVVLYFDLELDFIKNQGPITAVDRSPWHGRFIRGNLSNNQKNDVRLLKQFFKANYSYGDKSSVGKVGFIGYSAELLIYYYETIQNVFNNFHTLNSKPLDFYKRKSSDLEKIPHFQNDYLIIVDPIDKNRNVGSAISEQAYKYCNHRITQFLKNPEKALFEIEPVKIADPKLLNASLLSKLFVVELKNSDDNIHYTINRDKLHSLGENIKNNGEKELNHTERFTNIVFEVYFEDEINEYNLCLYCETPELSRIYTRRGPPIKESTHVKKFVKKNPTYFEKDGFLWVEVQRKFTDFLSFLKNFIEVKLPANFEVINVSNVLTTRTSSGKKAITILKDMVLPFYTTKFL